MRPVRAGGVGGGGQGVLEWYGRGEGELAVGDAVRFVFRIKDIDEQNAYLRYFWKAVPATCATAAVSPESIRRSA